MLVLTISRLERRWGREAGQVVGGRAQSTTGTVMSAGKGRAERGSLVLSGRRQCLPH